MRTSLCTKIITSVFLLSNLFSFSTSNFRVTKHINSYTPKEIDDAWIVVPWSHGGQYYHNTITREDRDNIPTCLQIDCKWNKYPQSNL